jgi:hypothetical protein
MLSSHDRVGRGFDSRRLHSPLRPNDGRSLPRGGVRWPHSQGARRARSPEQGSAEWRSLPAAPSFRKPPPRTTWSKPTKDWWAAIWRSPMATQWLESDVFELLYLGDLMELPKKSAEHYAEIRQLKDRFGLNPKARRGAHVARPALRGARSSRRPSSRRTCAGSGRSSPWPRRGAATAAARSGTPTVAARRASVPDARVRRRRADRVEVRDPRRRPRRRAVRPHRRAAAVPSPLLPRQPEREAGSVAGDYVWRNAFVYFRGGSSSARRSGAKGRSPPRGSAPKLTAKGRCSSTAGTRTASRSAAVGDTLDPGHRRVGGSDRERVARARADDRARRDRTPTSPTPGRRASTFPAAAGSSPSPRRRARASGSASPARSRTRPLVARANGGQRSPTTSAATSPAWEVGSSRPATRGIPREKRRAADRRIGEPGVYHDDVDPGAAPSATRSTGGGC